MSAVTTVTANDKSAAPAYSFSRLLYWNMRRELWDNRSVWIAPLAASGLLIAAVLLLVLNVHNDGGMPPQAVGKIGSNLQSMWIAYLIPAGPALGIGVIVAITYCLGALHNERRDRSILFWKSLPVSDLNTVLSKAALPLAVIPLVTFAVAVVTQLLNFAIMLGALPLLGANTHVVWGGAPVNNLSVAAVWAATPVGYITLGMLYGLLAFSLWYAPVYAWLLLVGGWARRMSFLWAIAPPIGLSIFERVALGTNRTGEFFQDRLSGALDLAFRGGSNASPPVFTPQVFFLAPGLWVGLGLTALFLTAAVLLRRYRQPI